MDVVLMGKLIRLLTRTAMMAGDQIRTPPLSGGPQDDDKRARVLDTAITHFAATGFATPGLAEIARTAGVATDDILALFGDEEGLRRACDDHVLEAVVGWAREKATLEGMREVMRSYQADPRNYQAQMAYLGRVVVENTPAAPRFIDVLVDESEAIIRAGIRDGTMRPSDDPRALAVLTATTVLGLITMAPHIERALGLPASQQQMLLRLALPALEIYTHGLYTNDSYLTLVRGAVSALQQTQQEEQTPGTGSPKAPSQADSS
ncbi:TetR family transcriptional regulator [Arthrobacter methylotrophus]|uniref:HTH tetR-type domain-containing protein n=1 Tax=Arthrobacter methylotrophus TaxID=121291 RepID=A0ABV5UKV0_9MICC